MTDDIFTEADMKSAAECPTLGPAYFASRRITERFIASFEAEHFKPLIDEFEKKFADALWNSVSASLLADTESNLTGEMFRMVDACVKAILEGKGWALNKYVLSERYDGERIRAAVASLVPRELQDKRIEDLEDEVKRLREQLRFYQS